LTVPLCFYERLTLNSAAVVSRPLKWLGMPFFHLIIDMMNMIFQDF